MSFLEKQKKITSEIFVAILIEERSVQAAIWKIEDDETKIISLGQKQDWSDKKTGELTQGADLSLSGAVSKLTETDQEPKKIIFGLPQSWTEKGKIAETYLVLLKRLSTKLSLKPVGFVVTIEALVHLLKAKEGVSPSAILIGLSAKEIQVTLVRLGKALLTENVACSENLALDVEEGLLRFPKEDTFPPKMILYGDGNLETAKQILISYPWQEPERKLPFLHFPQVEAVTKDFAIQALCLAGGTEIGESKQLAMAVEEKTVEERPIEKETKPNHDLGFVVGKNVLIGQKEDLPVVESAPVAPVMEKEKPKNNRRLGLILAKVKNLIKIKRFLPKLSNMKLSMSFLTSRSPRLAFVGLFLIILAGGFLVFRIAPKAQITIFVNPEILEEEFELILDPDIATPDVEKGILPADKVETSVSESKTKITTGSKLIGEKAKGEIIIFNIGDSKDLAAKTVLIGPGELEFTLDQTVSVAEGSALGGSGQISANVTAVDIGADYNLAAESEFTITSFDKSVLAAKNISAFSGGTSRQVQVVSEEDRTSLKSDLEKELTAKAKEDIMGKTSGSGRLVEESLQISTTEELYDRKVGEEYQEVSLTLTVEATGLVFEEDTLKDFLFLLLKDKVNTLGFRWEESQLNFKVLEVDDDRVYLQTNLTGKLYPQLVEEEIVQNLAGKNLSFQESYLSGLPKVVKFTTKITPAFFLRFNRLPWLEKNIKVEVKAE